MSRALSRPLNRPLSARATAATIFAIGFVVSLCGDATHVASGTTFYKWDDVPGIWNSAIWFPFAVASAVLAAAWASERFPTPAARNRTRADAIAAVALVLGLYALTAALRGEPDTVSVVLTGAIAVAIWAWWDPSPGALALGLAAAVLGTLAEIGVGEVGAAAYAADSDSLAGVPFWLPAIYFAAGAVAARLWAAVATDGAETPA